jgi:C1A family cysteine protease
MIIVTGVRPNSLAMQRVAAEQPKVQGKAAAATATPAKDGAEISGVKGLVAAARVTKSKLTAVSMAYPRAVDNSAEAWFPPIGDQNPLGSCASFCSTRYTMTSQVARLRGWNVRTGDNPAHIFSPRFTYNLINNGANNGSNHVTAFQLMISSGCATYADFPYDNVDYKSWPTTASVWRDAINYRMAECGSVQSIDTEVGLANAKQMLADGYVFNFAAAILDWKQTSFSNDPTTTSDDEFFDAEVPESHRTVVSHCVTGDVNHAMTVVGYNDHIWCDLNGNKVVDAGEKGALRIANSWGTWWGDQGFIWVSYDALKEVSAVAGGFSGARQQAIYSAQLEWMSARTSYTPSLVAEVTVTHAQRNQMSLKVGRGLLTETTSDITGGFDKLSGVGGPWAFDGTTTPVEATFVIDCTDWVNTGSGNRWFTSFTDSAPLVPGTLKKVRYIDSGNVATVASASNPIGGLPKPVDNATVYAYADNVLITNTVPVAKSLNIKTIKGEPHRFTLEATDINGDILKYSNVTLPSHGTLTSTGSSRIYTANSNYLGTDSFTFKVNDGKLDSAIATVIFHVGTSGSGLVAQFFQVSNNGSIPELTNKIPDLTRVDAQINYASATDFPSGYIDNFAARHTGFINIPTAGSYTFYLTSDDGSKLWIDGTQFVFNDGSHGADEKSGTVILQTGYHTLRVEYCQGGGGMALIMNWKGPGIAKSVVPASVLFYPVISNNTAPVVQARTLNISGDILIPAAITLVATDADLDTLDYATTLPTHGSLFYKAPNLGYLPDPGYVGADSFTYKANDGTADSNTATVSITMVNAAPTVAKGAAATPTIVTTATTLLSVLGANDGGEEGLVYTWATTGTPPAAVTFNANNSNAAKVCTATFAKAGSYAFQCIIKDLGGLTATSNVIVTVNQTPSGMAMTPGTAEVNLTKTQQYVAATIDQFGNALPNQPTFTWSLSNSTSGTLSSTGLFTANLTTGGPYTVTASGNGNLLTALVTVVAIDIPVGPPGYTWCSGEGGSFTLLGVSDVAFGAEGKFQYLYKKSGMITFNIATFSNIDPLPNYGKNGFFKLVPVNFAAWAITNNVTGGVNGDSDKDGIANGVEYALQLNPAAADGPVGTFNGNSLSFKKRMVASGSVGLTYCIEVSTDLGVTDPWVEQPSTQTADSIAAVMPHNTGKFFARLRVVLAP